MSATLAILAAVVLVAAWLRPIVLNARRALHLLQLEEYQTRRYWAWLARNRAAVVDPGLLASGGVVALGAAVLPFPFGLVVDLVGSGVGAWQAWRRKSPEAKKPLVLTARARRLTGGMAVCALALVGVTLALADRFAPPAAAPLVGAAAGLGLLGALTWPLTSLANLLLYPVEAAFRAYYLRSAAAVLRRYQPTVIGVAGSYGKTSTKMILAQILGSRFPTLATPRSFNTPMGLCRVVREQLRPEHRYFVAELGTYQRGEIRQLCRLVQPTIGLLTAVGPEHLERFGSLENVVKAEFELIEALPASGLALFNGDDPTCRELARGARCRALLVGSAASPELELWAEDVRLTSEGLAFTLCHRNGCRAAVTTHLLGRHNVVNILLASAAALACGLAFDDLAPAIRQLEPVEHRLQLVPNDNGVVVIDDTYNSNPRGAAAALEALASFQGGRRYLVTPGMVELAELQDPAHRELGRLAAAVCDGVILIGPRRTRAIADGLMSAGFAPERLIVAQSLADATERLRGLLRRGDVVLFENDLPDNYLE